MLIEIFFCIHFLVYLPWTWVCMHVHVVCNECVCMCV